MVSNNHYAVVGGFFVAMIVITLTIVVWLTSGISGARYEHYIVRTSESIAGLSIKAPVKYNGVNVGWVRSIQLSEKSQEEVDILLDIESRMSVRGDTQVFLEGQGLTGIMYINLRGGSARSPMLMRASGERYPVMYLQPTLSSRAEKRLQELSSVLIQVGNKMNALLSEKNQSRVERLLENTAKASDTFPTVLKQSQIMMKDMAHTNQQLQTTLQAVHNNLLPDIDNNVVELNDITRNLSALSHDLRDNPSLLLRGKTQPMKGPGEK